MFTPELVNVETGEYVLVANHNTESESAARLSIEYNSAGMAYGRNHLPPGVDKCVLAYDLRGQNVPSEVLRMIREAFREIHELDIVIALRGVYEGKRWTMPPDLRSIAEAKPGKYNLHATGEVVTDPDLLSTWTITNPAEH